MAWSILPGGRDCGANPISPRPSVLRLGTVPVPVAPAAAAPASAGARLLLPLLGSEPLLRAEDGPVAAAEELAVVAVDAVAVVSSPMAASRSRLRASTCSRCSCVRSKRTAKQPSKWNAVHGNSGNQHWDAATRSEGLSFPWSGS